MWRRGETSPLKETLVDAFEAIIHHVQYELPEYNMPGAALIRPKDSEDEKDFMLIRMMVEGTPYILQYYDYLMLRPDEATKEVIFIDNDDLAEIDEMEFWTIIGRQNLSNYG